MRCDNLAGGICGEGGESVGYEVSEWIADKDNAAAHEDVDACEAACGGALIVGCNVRDKCAADICA